LSFCLISTILAASLADLFPSTFVVTALTAALAAASLAFAFKSLALIAAFLAGKALRSCFLSSLTLF
jgi:hypothetical protein